MYKTHPECTARGPCDWVSAATIPVRPGPPICCVLCSPKRPACAESCCLQLCRRSPAGIRGSQLRRSPSVTSNPSPKLPCLSSSVCRPPLRPPPLPIAAAVRGVGRPVPVRVALVAALPIAVPGLLSRVPQDCSRVWRRAWASQLLSFPSRLCFSRLTSRLCHPLLPQPGQSCRQRDWSLSDTKRFFALHPSKDREGYVGQATFQERRSALATTHV